jgi:hypothetical protein
MTTAAETFADRLVRAPRLAGVEAYDGRTIVTRVDVPDAAADRLVPMLHCHRLEPSGSWSRAWTTRGFAAALAGAGEVAYATAGPNGQEIRWRRLTGEEPRTHALRGRAGAIVADPASGALACTVQAPGPTASSRRPTGLAGLDAAWFDDQMAALGTARRGDGPWAVQLLAPRVAVLPLAAPAGTVLTGELAWLGSGSFALGAARHLRDGRCRFGLLLVEPGGELRAAVFDDGIDLTGAVTSPDGSRVACLGTTMPAGEEPMAQRPCLVAADGELTALAVDDDLWHRPRAWVDDSRLCCVAEDGPRRRLVVHDLSAGGRSPVAVDASVLDAAPAPAVDASPPPVAAIVSSLDGAPALRVTGAAAVEVESTPGLEPPGRLRRVELGELGPGVPTAAWLCEPTGAATALAVFFHGGPLKSWTDWAWRWSPWPFVEAGLAVALVEPPMSLGYGARTVAAGWRRWRLGIGAAAVRQVRAARRVAQLEQAPLALFGGSFGGYLALLTATALEPALVVAHGTPADLRQVAAVTDVGWQWVREYGHPDAAARLYDEQSLRAEEIAAGTRVLLSHGLEDELVPATESLRVHRSLVRRGVRSELALFRGEGHPVLRPSNLAAWFAWALDACEQELGHRDQGRSDG